MTPVPPARIRRALAAAITPLRDGGTALDEAAFAPYVAFLADGGIDGVLALGTTGEGILLSAAERRRALELFLTAAGDRLAIVAHCGAQTTAETVALAAHAAEQGAAGVAVIAPPYYAFDEREQLEHLAAAARACAPIPFYVYEFAARSGYAIAPTTVERLRERAPNLAGMKVSDTPLSAVEPYLLDGLDIFVGSEALLPAVPRAAGTVTGLGAVYPEVVAALVRDPSGPALGRAGALRALLVKRFAASAKVALALRGLPIRPDVRTLLRPLDSAERAALERALDAVGG